MAVWEMGAPGLVESGLPTVGPHLGWETAGLWASSLGWHQDLVRVVSMSTV